MPGRMLFALAYLGGALVGVPAGHMLPWWASGAPAWILAIGLGLALWWLAVVPATAKPAVMGTLYGALAGAAAVDIGQSNGAPGDLIALLIAVAWALGEWITSEDKCKPLPLFRVGLALYAVTVVVCLLPSIMEALT